MTQHRDTEQLLDAWIARRPDRSRPTASSTSSSTGSSGKAQRPAWRLDWRRYTMNPSLKIAAAALAVVIVAVIGYNLLPAGSTNVGGPRRRRPRLRRRPPTATPTFNVERSMRRRLSTCRGQLCGRYLHVTGHGPRIDVHGPERLVQQVRPACGVYGLESGAEHRRWKSSATSCRPGRLRRREPNRASARRRRRWSRRSRPVPASRRPTGPDHHRRPVRLSRSTSRSRRTGLALSVQRRSSDHADGDGPTGVAGDRIALGLPIVSPMARSPATSSSTCRAAGPSLIRPAVHRHSSPRRCAVIQSFEFAP